MAITIENREQDYFGWSVKKLRYSFLYERTKASLLTAK